MLKQVAKAVTQPRERNQEIEQVTVQEMVVAPQMSVEECPRKAAKPALEMVPKTVDKPVVKLVDVPVEVPRVTVQDRAVEVPRVNTREVF